MIKTFYIYGFRDRIGGPFARGRCGGPGRGVYQVSNPVLQAGSIF